MGTLEELSAPVVHYLTLQYRAEGFVVEECQEGFLLRFSVPPALEKQSYLVKWEDLSNGKVETLCSMIRKPD